MTAPSRHTASTARHRRRAARHAAVLAVAAAALVIAACTPAAPAPTTTTVKPPAPAPSTTKPVVIPSTTVPTTTEAPTTSAPTTTEAPTTTAPTTTVPPTTEPPTTTEPPAAPAALEWEARAWQPGVFDPYRHWDIGKPDNIADGEKVPVLFILHGAGQNRHAMKNFTELNAHAVERGFIVVYPQGLWDSWNVGGQCCGLPSAFGTNDTGYLNHVLAEVAARPDVDTSRIYFSGYSNGSMMASHFVCNHAALPIAGMALGAGPTWNTTGCANKDLRIYSHHGTPDVIVPYNGGYGVGSLAAAAAFRPAASVSAELAARLGCDPTYTDTVLVDSPSVVDRSWSNCERGAIRFVTNTHHHVWPNQDGWDAETDLLDFLGL